MDNTEYQKFLNWWTHKSGYGNGGTGSLEFEVALKAWKAAKNLT